MTKNFRVESFKDSLKTLLIFTKTTNGERNVPNEDQMIDFLKNYFQFNFAVQLKTKCYNINHRINKN